MQFNCFILLISAIAVSNAQSQITTKEQNTLEKFRPLVLKFLSNDFMKTDEYLVNWLREYNLDTSAAKDALLNTLKWRKDNHIEESINEDFSSYERNLPFNVDGEDKQGRPVQIAPAGQWRPRQAVLAGNLDQYNRFMIRTMLEIPFQKIQEKMGEGRNVSQYILLFDMHGINAREHVCLQCIQVYANLVRVAERHYPRLAFKTVFINSPRIFDTILQAVRPLMTSYSRDNLIVLDHNRDKWQPQLREWINPDQLPPRYGGTKQFRPNDYYAQSYDAIDTHKSKE